MPQEADSKRMLYCSFCGKSQHETKRLIAGPTVFICDECVILCVTVLIKEGYAIEDFEAHLTITPENEAETKSTIRQHVMSALREKIRQDTPYLELAEAFKKFEEATRPIDLSPK